MKIAEKSPCKIMLADTPRVGLTPDKVKSPWNTGDTFDGGSVGLTPDKVKSLEVTGKYGREISGCIRDAAGRENAVLIVDMASQPELCAVLAELAGDQLASAAKACAEAIGAKDLIAAVPDQVHWEADGIQCISVLPSPVLCEESALYHMLETGELRSAPLERDFPSQGYEGRPTVAVDGETLLKIYAMAGSDYQNTKLLLVKSGEETLLAEAPVGMKVSTLLEQLEIKTSKPILLGGVTGEFSDGNEAIAWDKKFDTVTVFTEKDCMADQAAKLLCRAQEESCKKCVLCREGTWHLAGIFQGITQGKGKKEDLDMVLDIGPLIEAGAFCSFGKGMARAAVTAVRVCRDELEAHITKKKCPAGVCAAFSKTSYCIHPGLCTGCGDCEDECDEMAIEGKKKFIYMIDPDMCTGCGKCVSSCDEEAIKVNDGTIKLPKKLTRVGKFK